MEKGRKINVLVVEDSSVAPSLLVHLLNSDAEIQVVGTASNGQAALTFLARKVPDVILMDVEMPDMDGFETTRRIMETQPVPIVICSGASKAHDASTTFRLMEVGAVAFVEKPSGKEHLDYEEGVEQLLQTVKLMSEVKVVRRWPRRNASGPVSPAVLPTEPPRAKIELVGIGASTGGPPVIQTILTALPKDFPVPILVVQHIAPGFLGGFVEWLNQTTGFKVHIAAYGTRPLPGHVYLAPDDFHLMLRSDREIILSKENPEEGLRPAISCLFRSLAQRAGSNAIGVLLTGMGKDGAAELKQMRDAGAFTIVQDRETSVVHGMPGAAIALGAARCILPADKIAAALISQINSRLYQ